MHQLQKHFQGRFARAAKLGMKPMRCCVFVENHLKENRQLLIKQDKHLVNREKTSTSAKQHPNFGL
jgi:hypothetical protein